jgi:hypothetical protein
MYYTCHAKFWSRSVGPASMTCNLVRLANADSLARWASDTAPVGISCGNRAPGALGLSILSFLYNAVRLSIEAEKSLETASN